jgi:hypothetical protein
MGCDDLMVLDARHASHANKRAALRPGSSRPHHQPPQVFPGDHAERLHALPHGSPREFGHLTSL